MFFMNLKDGPVVVDIPAATEQALYGTLITCWNEPLLNAVTVYDPETRSEIQTNQEWAALRSLFELKDASGTSIDLYFGPKAPAGQEGRWIQTLPSKGWFVYFRIYGPEAPAFDGSWKPGDFEEEK